MKSSTNRTRRFRRTALTIAAATLGLGQLVLAGEARFQTVIHDKDLYGVEDIENGRYEAGIEKLSKRVYGGRQPHSTRVPALIDLCAAYTMTQQNEKAAETCDEAV
ncbi:MAG: hypothetical protein ACN4GT_02875, partial [Gammaproteobacteria bacterium]